MANIFLLALGVQLLCLQHAGASWGSPDSNQYHIQTDEGPERYFRYQTDNGQFRKEKRLQDGTVIGTDAWIDASGYLRQNDYIADHKGYRILKSKTVYVGHDRPIQDAIKVAKNKPADSGILVPSDPSYEPPTAPPPPPPSSLPPIPSRHRPSSVQPIAFVPSTTAPITLLRHPTPSLNAVFVRPHSEPIASNYLPSAPHDSEQQHYPSTSPRPPPLDIYVPSTTYAPLTGNELSSAPIALYSPSSSTPSPLRDGSEAHLPPLVLYHNGHIEATTYNPRRRKPNPAERRRRPVNPILITSARPYLESTTPASTFSHNPQEQQQQQQLHLLPTSTRLDSDSNLLDDYNRDLIDSPVNRYDRYNSRYSNRGSAGSTAIRRTDTAESHPYDGVAVTNDGFRYYLPRQYHEERNSASDTRDGSFGYIDPFGIRRVIYYNTDPQQGFVHRKNNRFVGFDATPYDPRPLGA
ncbi:mediator of RNA polymerase II transcription subunit 13-like [Anopheles albimanus]|nr:mediator of RNA polymerase II transcription subunit 13-like [Anopheles albimanus]XP_035785449.1 mediator of RNA polymerase II transcription subunit 13-like [Anopheles albimanus]XP_035785450.1 mediator of RNA polymerase II transcription subunit 13-like [Anopheles albimanus]XP_035785451.1 mediator of RNA polymerase II transcription subunit 13-like [Anopheles albimanus]